MGRTKTSSRPKPTSQSIVVLRTNRSEAASYQRRRFVGNENVKVMGTLKRSSTQLTLSEKSWRIFKYSYLTKQTGAKQVAPRFGIVRTRFMQNQSVVVGCSEIKRGKLWRECARLAYNPPFRQTKAQVGCIPSR